MMTEFATRRPNFGDILRLNQRTFSVLQLSDMNSLSVDLNQQRHVACLPFFQQKTLMTSYLQV